MTKLLCLCHYVVIPAYQRNCLYLMQLVVEEEEELYTMDQQQQHLKDIHHSLYLIHVVLHCLKSLCPFSITVGVENTFRYTLELEPIAFDRCWLNSYSNGVSYKEEGIYIT